MLLYKYNKTHLTNRNSETIMIVINFYLFYKWNECGKQFLRIKWR
jgi:hypothetical protein